MNEESLNPPECQGLLLSKLLPLDKGVEAEPLWLVSPFPGAHPPLILVTQQSCQETQHIYTSYNAI